MATIQTVWFNSASKRLTAGLHGLLGDSAQGMPAIVIDELTPLASPLKLSYAPVTRYNLLSNRLSNPFDNRFDNRLYRVYSRLSNRFDNRFDVCLHDTAGCIV